MICGKKWLDHRMEVAERSERGENDPHRQSTG